MKRILFFLVAAVIVAACSKKPELQIEKGENGSATLRFKATQKYLLLPMEDRGAEKTLKFSADGSTVNTFVIRPAQNQIDYWMPLELGAWNKASMEVFFEGMEGYDLFFGNVKLSDTLSYDYAEKYRPLYHFTPPYGWMNDPNGMVYYDGEYHLAYQHNPYGTRWQNMSWGHAVSRDLVRWEHLPEALFPDTLGAIFSGSAVVDHNNTSGLQEGDEKTLLAYFTHAGRFGQMQSLATSNDRGRTWTKYAGNPVLKNEAERDFRDPKVFWYEATGKWIMILAVGQKMEIYSSANGLDWALESRFGEGQGNHGGVWECPDLFELPVEGEPGNSKWVLVCNINPGGPSGGSATQYFTGSFDGSAFVNDAAPEVTKWMDYGKDHYATVSWANVPEEDGRRIVIGWMSNWEYANDVPTLNFRSATTVARELKLVRKNGDLVVASYPVKELESLRTTPVNHEPFVVDKEFSMDNFLAENEGAYEITMNLSVPQSGVFGFTLMNSLGDSVTVTLNSAEGKLIMDRTHSGLTDFSDPFPAITVAPLAAKTEYAIRLLADKASLELFEGSGETVMTNIVFPQEPYNRIRFFTEEGSMEVKELTIYKLEI